MEERLLAAGLKTQQKIRQMRQETYQNVDETSRSGPTINFRSRLMDRSEQVGQHLYSYAGEYRERREALARQGAAEEKATMRGPKITKKAKALQGRGSVVDSLYSQRHRYQGRATQGEPQHEASAPSHWQGAGAR